MALSPGFEWCRIKYRKKAAHILVTMEKENNRNIIP
jgi:hypothetical protein